MCNLFISVATRSMAVFSLSFNCSVRFSLVDSRSRTFASLLLFDNSLKRSLALGFGWISSPSWTIRFDSPERQIYLEPFHSGQHIRQAMHMFRIFCRLQFSFQCHTELPLILVGLQSLFQLNKSFVDPKFGRLVFEEELYNIIKKTKITWRSAILFRDWVSWSSKFNVSMSSW